MPRVKGAAKPDAAEAFDPNVAPEGAPVADTPPAPRSHRKATAVTSDSDRYNQAMQRKIAKRSNGEMAPIKEEDALSVFEHIRNLFPPQMIAVSIRRVSGGDPVQARPMSMTAFRTSADLYDYVLKHVHKTHPAARYDITFKEGMYQRGSGHLDLEDTTTKVDPMAGMMPFAPMPPGMMGGFPQGVPQIPGAFPPGMYPNGQWMPGYGPNGYGPQATPAAPPAAPAPSPESSPEPRYSTHEPRYSPVAEPMMQPMAPMYPQGGVDPMTAALYQQLKEMQELLRQNQLQLERTLGEQEAMKRQMAQGYPPAYGQGPQGYLPPGYPAPQGYGVPGYPPPPGGQAQGAGPAQGAPNAPPGYPPPGYPPSGYDPRGYPPSGYPQGYPPPGYPTQAPVGVGAPPAAAPAAVPPVDPMAHLRQSAEMIRGVAQQVQGIRKMFMEPVHQEGEEEEESIEDAVGIPQPTPVKPPPFQMIPLGAPGSNPPVIAMGEDGKINKEMTLIGNLPHITNFMKGLGEMARTMQQQPQQGYDPGAQQQQQLPPQPPPQLPPQPAAPFVPNLGAFRPTP